MRYFCVLLLCLIASVLVLVPQSGRTDPMPMDYHASPTGGGISPKSPHETIRMSDQEVIIRLRPRTYTVDAVFHLSNSGDTTTEWVGFPKNAMGHPPGPRGGVSDFIRFEAWVNGQTVPFVEERDFITGVQQAVQQRGPLPVNHSSWLIGQATFPGREITTLRISYEAPFDNCGLGCQQAVYIYGTGGYWKDSIGRAVFIVDSTEQGGVARADAKFSAPDTQKNLIHRRRIAENVVRYEVRDLEPLPDGTLSITLGRQGRH